MRSGLRSGFCRGFSRASVKASVGDSVGGSVWASVKASVGVIYHFFQISRNETLTTKVRTVPAVYRFMVQRACANFDGKKWRLHAGEKQKLCGKGLYENVERSCENEMPYMYIWRTC